jgi:hypothetical protein
MKQLALNRVEAAAPYEAYLIPVSPFPLQEPEATSLAGFLDRFISVAAHAHSLTSEVFMQLEQLGDTFDEGRVAFSANAKTWMPQTGLGVWVDRDPPQKWTIEEFNQLGPDDKPRPLMFQVFRVTKQHARTAARSAMLPFGSVMEILTPMGDTYVTNAGKIFKAGITDPSFTCFPYYVGLLEGKTVRHASRKELDRWFDGMTVYIRQSYEDQGVLVASSAPLAPILERIGAVTTSSGWSYQHNL